MSISYNEIMIRKTLLGYGFANGIDFLLRHEIERLGLNNLKQEKYLRTIQLFVIGQANENDIKNLKDIGKEINREVVLK